MTIDDVEDQLPKGSSPWSVWGVRLVALLTVAMAISLGFAWIQQSYRGVSVNTELSFPANDRPWMPVGTTPVPISGNHYFGDFQLPYGWALNVRNSQSPYLSSEIPANYPPLSILFFVPFTIFPVKIATMLFLLLSAVVFSLPLWLLLSPLRISYRCIMLAPIVLVTTPFLGMLDRGNNIGIAIGLIAWAALAWRSERLLWCGVFLAAAIALKAYPAVLLVVPIALRRYRFSALVATSALGINLLALAFIPGGYGKNLHAAVPAMTSQRLTNLSQFDSWSLYSLLPKTVGLLLGPDHASRFLFPSRILLWLPSILYLVLVFVIIRRQRVPQWCWGALSLASIQLVVPLSGAYTTGWACLAAIWFAWGSLIQAEPITSDNEAVNKENMPLRIVLMLALSASLVPSIFRIYGTGGLSISATRFLSPALLFVTLCLALAKSLMPQETVSTLETAEEPAFLAA